MKTILIICFSFCTAGLQAQYFYNDIIGTQEINRQMKNYVDKKVRTVTATGFDQRGARQTDFTEVQEVKENGTLLRVSTINSFKKTVLYSKFDSQGRVIRTTDSSSAVNNVATYSYNAEGRLSRIENITRDSANDFNQVETHQWIYGSNGQPVKMWRTINNQDSLEVRFKPDDNGYPGDERSYKKGVETGQYYYMLDEKNQPTYVQTGAIYYYYDDRNRLTDVVRFNLKAARLLPDLLFEYDDNDLVIQKITTSTNASIGYLTWRYIFSDKQLKTKEVLFNKEKKITGRIEYHYTFGN